MRRRAGEAKEEGMKARTIVSPILFLTLIACGGTSPTITPAPTPTPTPAPVRHLVENARFTMNDAPYEQRVYGFPYDAGRLNFNVDHAGKLEVDISWTYATNTIIVAVYRGICQPTEFYAGTCDKVNYFSLLQQPPATLAFGDVTAGTYTIWTGNQGDKAESGTYQAYVVY
jgi:hypothetical protein